MEYQPAEPDVGIMAADFFCTECEVDVPEWEYDDDDDEASYVKTWGLP